ncbi:MAG: class II glutamine amidotransferase [Pseudomonadota bacterium]
MCELFAMSSSEPTTLKYSLDEFSRNGSKLRNNRDGWGIAMARDRDVILVKEPEPATDSIWVRFIADNAIETDTAIAHVRYATRGVHTMENTHPFRRALGRRTQVFAHNGTLAGIFDGIDVASLAYEPIGETDSELAFCTLLTRIAPLYAGDERPTVDARFDAFAAFCDEMMAFGNGNFLYYDGDVLFAHGHRRVYEEGGEHTEPKPPGLQIKKCWSCAAQNEIHSPGLDMELRDQQTVLFASVPLDEDGWEPLDEGAVVAVKAGKILRESS